LRNFEVHFDCLPDKRLYENAVRSSNHFGTTRGPEKRAKKKAYRIFWDLGITPIIDKFELRVVFVFPDKRVKDLTGLLSGIKPWVDGMVEAEFVKKDDWEHLVKLTVEPEYKKGESDTIFFIKEVE
jgi:hypothetical protein